MIRYVLGAYRQNHVYRRALTLARATGVKPFLGSTNLPYPTGRVALSPLPGNKLPGYLHLSLRDQAHRAYRLPRDSHLDLMLSFVVHQRYRVAGHLFAVQIGLRIG